MGIIWVIRGADGKQSLTYPVWREFAAGLSA